MSEVRIPRTSAPAPGSESGQELLDRVTIEVQMRCMANLTTCLLSALRRLNAPQSVLDAVTEDGDLEHVNWWITAPNEKLRHGDQRCKLPQSPHTPPLVSVVLQRLVLPQRVRKSG